MSRLAPNRIERMLPPDELDALRADFESGVFASVIYKTRHVHPQTQKRLAERLGWDTSKRPERNDHHRIKKERVA